MRRYIDEVIEPEARRIGPQRALLQALYGSPDAGAAVMLDYDADFTRNAAEAFDARAGNCLSLAVMTGALAGALGLEVVYQSVDIDDTWGLDGDLGLFVGHVSISVGKKLSRFRSVAGSPDWWTIDFVAPELARQQRAVPISKARLTAMYMANKSAESLAKGHLDDAYAWIKAAIEIDPGDVDAYNTLGVVYWRRGLQDDAERVFRATLAMKDTQPQAMANLAALLREGGRGDEADELDRRLARMKAVSPFATFRQGLKAYAEGRYLDARDLFQRALARSNDYHEFHFWLAEAYLRLGDDRRGQDELRLAEANSATRKQRDLYATKLKRLAAPSSGGLE